MNIIKFPVKEDPGMIENIPVEIAVSDADINIKAFCNGRIDLYACDEFLGMTVAAENGETFLVTIHADQWRKIAKFMREYSPN